MTTQPSAVPAPSLLRDRHFASVLVGQGVSAPASAPQSVNQEVVA